MGYSVMSNWYYLDEINQVNGPLSPHEMRNKVSDSVAYVWREGLDEWTLSSDCPELYIMPLSVSGKGLGVKVSCQRA